MTRFTLIHQKKIVACCLLHRMSSLCFSFNIIYQQIFLSNVSVFTVIPLAMLLIKFLTVHLNQQEQYTEFDQMTHFIPLKSHLLNTFFYLFSQFPTIYCLNILYSEILYVIVDCFHRKDSGI